MSAAPDDVIGSGSPDGAWDKIAGTEPGNQLPLAPTDGVTAPRFGVDGPWGAVPAGAAAAAPELDAAVESL